MVTGGRTTWAGCVFGHWQEKCIDYIALDERSCHREHHGRKAHGMAMPSDHLPIGVCIFFRYGRNEAERRGKQNPIGWHVRAENAGKWVDYMYNTCTDWTTTHTITDLTRALQGGQHLGSRRHIQSQATTRSPLQDDLQQRIDDVTTSADERQRLRHQLFKERDRITRQRRGQWYKHVLKNLAQGGWVKAAMTERMPDMQTVTSHDGSKTTDRHKIAEEAYNYCGGLFTIEDPEGKMVTDLTTSTFEYWGKENCTIKAEEVPQAVMEAKDGRTCASSDLLVAEAWKAATLADPRWSASIAWAHNRRIERKCRE